MNRRGGKEQLTGRQNREEKAAAVKAGSSGEGRQQRWGRAAKVDFDDGSCSRLMKQLRGARRQSI